MVLTNRWLLSGVLLSCCFGALACSDEPATLGPSIDGSVRAPVDTGEEPEDDDTVAKPKKDAGAKDAGAKDGGAKDAGAKDAGTVRGIDSGVTTGTGTTGTGTTGTSTTGTSGGPSVVGAKRAPNPAENIADSDGVPAVRTERCPAGASMAPNGTETLLLEGCCLASGECGIVPTLEEFRTTCVTRAQAETWVKDENKDMIRVTLPPAATCSNAGN